MKTNELQQLTSILGTDSLLADTADAGTGRLTLAQAAVFFGAELVKPENPVGASLSQKAAISAQETVENKTVVFEEVHVAASNLQTYFDNLPKLRTNHLSVVVSGEMTQTLKISCFFGSGRIYIFPENEQTVFRAGIHVESCTVPVYLRGLHFEAPSTAPTETLQFIRADQGSIVIADNGVFAGVPDINLPCALSAASGGRVISTTMKASYCGGVALVATGGIAVIDCAVAADMHDNHWGVHMWSGGLAIIAGSNTPALLGGIAHHKQGGAVINYDGTLA